jgi:hypothetical protein
MGFFRNRNALAAASATPTIYSASDTIVGFFRNHNDLPTFTPPHTLVPHVHVHSVPLVSSSSDQTSCHYTRYKVYYHFYPHNPVYVRRLGPSILEFSLSLHRHPSICILFSSRFTSYNEQIMSHTVCCPHVNSSSLRSVTSSLTIPSKSHSLITLTNLSTINLDSIFRCSSQRV